MFERFNCDRKKNIDKNEKEKIVNQRWRTKIKSVLLVFRFLFFSRLYIRRLPCDYLCIHDEKPSREEKIFDRTSDTSIICANRDIQDACSFDRLKFQIFFFDFVLRLESTPVSLFRSSEEEKKTWLKIVDIANIIGSCRFLF